METRRLNVITAFLNSILNLKMLTLLGVLIFSISALAMNGRTTYQAKIIKPDGYPLEASSVNFRFTVLDTVGSCVLYVEDYTAVNMSQSGGLISFALGNGARSFPVSGTSQTFQNTFDNSVTSFSCQTPGIYNPGPNDTRKIVMQFHDGSGWQTLPAMTVNAVPYAMYASKSNDSKTLNGKADTAFVENSTLAALNCNPATHAITFNGVSFSCIPVGSSGGGITSVTTSGTVLSTGGTASAPVISIQAATMSQDGYLTSLDYAEFKAKLTASSTQIVNTLGYAPVSSSAVTTQINNSNLSGDVSGTILSNSVVSVGGKTASQISTSVDDTLAATTSATANTIVKRNSLGNFTANDVYANAAKINYVDIYKPSTSFNIRLQAPTSLSTNYVLNLPTTSGTIGQVLSTDGAGNLSWINPSTGSVVSVSATAPLASSGGSNPTISITQATSSTDGYLSSTDWNTFNNKQAATSAAIIATLGYTPATSTTLAASFVQKTGDTMTGLLTLKAGTTTNAPLKFTSGTLLTSPQSGTMEYDGTNFYLTDSTNTRRAIAANTNPGTYDNVSNINSSGNITMTPVGSVVVSSTTASTNSSTGALIVKGGLGVAGDIYTSGTIVTSSNIQGVSVTATSGMISPYIAGSVASGGSLTLDSTTHANKGNILLAPNGGNVGIGTTAPGSFKLKVVNDLSAAFIETAGTNGTTFRQNTSGANQIYSDYFSGSTALPLSLGAFPTTQALNILPSGNVGIGMTNPVELLSVRGPSAAIALVNTSDGDGIQRFKAIANGVGITSDVNDYALFVKRTNGNVGVGTSAPGARLEVSRNASASTAFDEVLRITQVNGTNGGAGPGLFFYGGTNNQAFGAIGGWNVSDGVGAQSAKLRFQTANAGTLVDRMVIDESGNVGIGTTTPTAKLQLAAGTSSTASFKLASGTLLTSPQSGTMEYDGAQFYLTDGTNTRRTIATGSSAGTIDNASTINSTGNITMVPVGSVVVSATTASTNSQTGALVVKGGLGITGNLYSSGTIVTSSNIQGSSITATSGVSTTVIQGVPYLALNPNGGNVGIGTTAPTQKLEVVGGKIQIDNNQGLYGRSTSGSLSRAIIAGNSSDNVEIGDSGGWNNVIFYPGSGEKMRITSSGNVGIGTASPSSYQHGGTNRVTEIFNSGTGLNNQSHIILSSGNSTNVDSSIGSITFAQPNMSDANKALALMAGTTDSDFTTGAPTSRLAFWTRGASETNWSQKMVIKGNGNVGIGTTSPSGILHLSSNATTGSQLIIQNTDTGGATVGIISTGSTNAGGAGLMRFDNPMGTDRMVITNTGNVGIGTTTPQATLDVAGSIAQNGRTTEQSGVIALTADGTYQIASGSELDGIYELNWSGANRNDYKKILVTSRQFDQANIIILGSNSYSNQSVISNIRVTGDASGAIRYLLVDVANRNGNTTNLFVRAYGPTPSLALASSGYGTTAITNVASILSDRSGNVGIGTTAPQTSLDVSGRTTLATASAHVLSVTGKGTTYSDSTDGIATFYSEVNVAAGGNVIKAGSAYAPNTFVVKDNGNVGVGTTSPDKTLVVNSTNTTNFAAEIYNSSSGASSNGLYVHSASTNPATMVAGIGSLGVMGDGNVGIGTTNPTALANIYKSFGGGASGGGKVLRVEGQNVSDANYTLAEFVHGGATPTMSIMASGNVGIGTTSPAAKLHVNGDMMVGTPSASFTTSVGIPANDPGGHNAAMVPTNITFGSGGANMTYKAVRNGANTFNDEYITFATHEGGISIGERMRITPNGNVGIGTTNPQRKLNVVGSVGVQDSSLAHIHSFSDTNGGANIDAYSGTSDSYFSVNTNLNGAGTSEKMRITGVGNVGIGTTSPGSDVIMTGGGLTINGTGSTQLTVQNSGVSAFALNVGAANNVVGGWTMFDKVGGTWNQSISSNSGRIGIGTASPGSNLEVMASGGGGITIKANPSSPNDTGDFVFRNNDDSERARIHAGTGDSTSNSLWFDINGANRMMINSSGNVGIGTTSPSYKLDVSGTIRGYGITDSSDIRLKKDIQPLDFSLEKLLQVNGVSYHWKNPAMPKKQIGFIAQQLEKIYPELVETDQDGFKSVNYSHLIAPVIESIKTLYHRTVNTERRVASLEKINNDQEKQIQAMQKVLCEMGRQEFCNDK